MLKDKACPICGNTINSACDKKLPFSYWSPLDRETLKREHLFFHIGKCYNCSYEGIIDEFSPELLKILYPDNFVSTALQKNREVYSDIINWTAEYFNNSTYKVADFGCGTLSFITALQKKQLNSDMQYYGIDHRNQIKEKITPPLHFIEADIFDMNSNVELRSMGFDFAFCIHTLEHFSHPREVLLGIKQKLNPNSFLYIEVPAGELTKSENLCSVELYGPQHISYFTLKTLELLTRLCGFKVLKKELKITNNIPRAKIVVQNYQQVNEQDFHVNNSLIKIEKILINVGEKILKLIEAGKRVALWGICADLDRIFQVHPSVQEKIKTDNVILVDSFLHGKKYLKKLITDPQDLINDNEIQIIIMPMLRNTRNSIKKTLEQYGFNKEQMTDPYFEFEK